MILILLAGIITLHIFVLSRLNFLPFPEFFVYPYLTNNGLVPYQDILDQHFLGLMFFPVNLDNLGFHTPADARIWQYGLAALTHVLLFIVARSLFKSNMKALLASALYLLWQPFFEGWMLWIDSFLPVFYLSAFYFMHKGLEEKKLKSLFFAGLFFGIATLFKQVVIPFVVLVGLYMLVKRRSSRELYYFALGYLPLPILMVVYVFSLGIFPDFWYWTVTYNMTVFAGEGRKFATQSELVRAAFVFGFAVLGLALAKNREKLVLILIFAAGASLAAYARFDFLHLQPALPFVILGTVYLFSTIPNRLLKNVLLVGYILVAVFFLRTFYRGNIGDKVYFFDHEMMEVASKITDLTEEGEHIFIFGASPHLYQVTKTLPAGNIFVFQFPWFMTVAGPRVLEALVTDQPNVIVANRAVTIQGNSITEYMQGVDEFILNNYREVDRIGTNQVFVRNYEYASRY